MIVTKTGEYIFSDPEEEKMWWAMIMEENQLDLDIEFRKRTHLAASDEYFRLSLAASRVGFEEDARRLAEKIHSSIAVLGSGGQGSNN